MILMRLRIKISISRSISQNIVRLCWRDIYDWEVMIFPKNRKNEEVKNVMQEIQDRICMARLVG